MNKGRIIFGAGLLIIVATILMSNYFDNAPESKDGIHFFKGSWKEAVNKAQSENKPIFLDIHATWCGPCKMLKRNTFPDKEVGQYFNAHYINASIDGESEEGRELMKRYTLHSYPSLLILDKNENAVLISPGYQSPSRLLEFGRSSFEKVNSTL